MKAIVEKIELVSKKHFELTDISNQVNKIVEKSGLKNGIIHVYTQHTTSAIKINENEAELLKDFEKLLNQLIPSGKGYGHDKSPVDDRKNAHSHLRSFFMSASETIPLIDKKMMLGTWQKIFFIELDGPRDKRTVIVQVLGE